MVREENQLFGLAALFVLLAAVAVMLAPAARAGTWVAGLDLGVLGFFGYDAATALFGPYTKIAYMVMGCGAVWQLFRQRFF